MSFGWWYVTALAAAFGSAAMRRFPSKSVAKDQFSAPAIIITRGLVALPLAWAAYRIQEAFLA